MALPEPELMPEPRKNMVWIPAGDFVAGTAPNAVPRLADEELPGVRLALNGFYIDQYPYPNEPGAIQSTDVTRDEAEERCKAQGKRLCTELEWERACKGPASTVYEYGNEYTASVCALSPTSQLTPTGARVGCKSGFDVHDMHGGAYEWTASAWGRGSQGDLVAVRGGSGQPGELIGRCANGLSKSPKKKASNVGFRCCAGDVNDAAVTLEVTPSAESFRSLPLDSELVPLIEASVPSSVTTSARSKTPALFKLDSLWSWNPASNDTLVLGAGCAYPELHQKCATLVFRLLEDRPVMLLFSPSDSLPRVLRTEERKSLWLYGDDENGRQRRRLTYQWGKITLQEPQRLGRRH